MPKMKTKRGAAKRFKRTASGKVMRHHNYKDHILTKKSTKRKRKLRKASVVDHADRKRMNRSLPYKSK